MKLNLKINQMVLITINKMIFFIMVVLIVLMDTIGMEENKDVFHVNLRDAKNVKKLIVKNVLSLYF